MHIALAALPNSCVLADWILRLCGGGGVVTFQDLDFAITRGFMNLRSTLPRSFLDSHVLD